MTETLDPKERPDHVGMRPPPYPEHGTAWQPSPADAPRYWHHSASGGGWYLEPPEGFPKAKSLPVNEKVEENWDPAATGTGADAIREMNAASADAESASTDAGKAETDAPTGEAAYTVITEDVNFEAPPVADAGTYADTAGTFADTSASYTPPVDKTAPKSDPVAEEAPAPKRRGRKPKAEAEAPPADPPSGQVATDDLSADTKIIEAQANGDDIGTEGVEDYQPSPAIERMEQIASEFELDHKALVETARDFLIEQIKNRPKPWSAMLEAEQRDVASAAEHASVELVRKIVEAIAAGEKQPIRCLLESYVEKDGIKLTLKVKTFNDEESLAAVLALHKARGKHVLVTAASVDDYRGGGDAKIDADAPQMDFEADAGDDDNTDG